MIRTYEGQFAAEGLRVGIVAARFNEFITSKLLSGALDALKRHGASDENLAIVSVPGAFEIPLAAQKLAASKQFDAVICLGAVIRGSTPHFEYVCAEVAKGIAQVGLQSGIPVIFGVITADTIEQAVERAGTKAGNKGFNAAMAAMEMANVLKLL